MRLIVAALLTSIFLVTAAWFLRDSFKNQRDIGTYRPAQSGVIFYDHLRADDSNYLMLNWYADSVFTCFLNSSWEKNGSLLLSVCLAFYFGKDN